jgi:hypothetical protein
MIFVCVENMNFLSFDLLYTFRIETAGNMNLNTIKILYLMNDYLAATLQRGDRERRIYLEFCVFPYVLGRSL